MIRSLFLSSLLFAYALGQPIPLLPHQVLTLQAQAPSPSAILSRDDIKDVEACRPITILSAYIEKDGNVGPAFFKSLVKMIRGRDSVAFQEMNYQFDGGTSDHPGKDQFSGGKVMARIASQVLEDCPSTNLVLSGSGHGSRVVHNAVAEMNQNLLDSVTAVVLFGPRSLSSGMREPQLAKANMACKRDSKTCATSKFMAKTRLVSPYRPQLAAGFVVDRISGRR